MFTTGDHDLEVIAELQLRTLSNICPGHTFTGHLAGSTTDQISWMTQEMLISVVQEG